MVSLSTNLTTDSFDLLDTDSFFSDLLVFVSVISASYISSLLSSDSFISIEKHYWDEEDGSEDVTHPEILNISVSDDILSSFLFY